MSKSTLPAVRKQKLAKTGLEGEPPIEVINVDEPTTRQLILDLKAMVHNLNIHINRIQTEEIPLIRGDLNKINARTEYIHGFIEGDAPSNKEKYMRLMHSLNILVQDMNERKGGKRKTLWQKIQELFKHD